MEGSVNEKTGMAIVATRMPRYVRKGD
jgi:hypothetical protein